jgi:hypothetical protein
VIHLNENDYTVDVDVPFVEEFVLEYVVILMENVHLFDLVEK